MAAYFVYICQEVVDRSELETYWSGSALYRPLDGGRTAAGGTTDAAHKDAQTQ